MIWLIQRHVKISPEIWKQSWHSCWDKNYLFPKQLSITAARRAKGTESQISFSLSNLPRWQVSYLLLGWLMKGQLHRRFTVKFRNMFNWRMFSYFVMSTFSVYDQNLYPSWILLFIYLRRSCETEVACFAKKYTTEKYVVRFIKHFVWSRVVP